MLRKSLGSKAAAAKNRGIQAWDRQRELHDPQHLETGHAL